MSEPLFAERAAITRTVWIVVVVAVLVVAGAGAFVLSSKSGGPGPIDLTIVESNPVTQADSFDPVNVTVVHGTTFTLAVLNGDDEPRTFEISALNINQTIGSDGTFRFTLTCPEPGLYKMFVPSTPPSAINGARASPSITGYIIAS
jgi:Cupredoxin-like domain